MRYCIFESAHYLAAVTVEDYLGNNHEFYFHVFLILEETDESHS